MNNTDPMFNIDDCIDAKSIRDKLEEFDIMQQYPLETPTHMLIMEIRRELEKRLAELD